MALLVLVVLLACGLDIQRRAHLPEPQFRHVYSQVQAQPAQTYYNGIRMGLSDLLKPLVLGVRSGHLGG